MIVRLRGIHKVTTKGTAYYYHRKSKQRISGAYGSAEFIAHFQELDAATQPKQTTIPGTWGHLVEKYKQNPTWDRLKPRTKESYNGVFDYLATARDVPLERMTPASILKVRDKAYNAKKITFANNLLAVMKLVFTWGIPAGYLDSNPAQHVKRIPKPKGQRKQNRAWTDSELKNFLDHAPQEIAIAVGLAGYVGVRRSDLVSIPWTAYDGTHININQQKTGDPIWVPLHKELKPLLDDVRKTALTIVTGKKGEPLTPDGFSTNFSKARKNLQDKGLIGEGLTIHGLRTTVATKLAEAGCSNSEIKAVTGHLSDASIKPYTEEARKKINANAAVLKWEQGSNKIVKL